MKTRFKIYRAEGRRWSESRASLSSFASSYRTRLGRVGIRMGCFCEMW